MSTYMFPGQGSQKIGMGETLFPHFPELLKQAEDILGYSLTRLCLEDPLQQLHQTQYTQPALYVVNALSYLEKIHVTREKPDYLIGHSLGEYNALYAAGVFNFTTGLQLVKKRGELMSQATDGAMAAIVGLKTEMVKALLAEHHLSHVTIANDNSYTQAVISGVKNDVEHAVALFKQAGAIMAVLLKTSGAFHSPLMKSAQEQFAHFACDYSFAAPMIPVFANTTAEPYRPHEIPQKLIEQISHPVRWTETIAYLLAQGETEFEEIGPGKVLTGMVKRIKNGQ